MLSYASHVLSGALENTKQLPAHRQNDPEGSVYPRMVVQMPQWPLYWGEPQSPSPPTLLDPTTLKGTADVPSYCFFMWILSPLEFVEMVMVLQILFHLSTCKPDR